jgi:hypothetical protein
MCISMSFLLPKAPVKFSRPAGILPWLYTEMCEFEEIQCNSLLLLQPE